MADRIVEGALRALAKRGARKLSMTDIHEEAQVSRATLYRYFRSKSEVLDAVGSLAKQLFRKAILERLDENSSPRAALRSTLLVLIHPESWNPTAGRLLRDDPAWALDFFTREMSHYVELVYEVIGDAVNSLPIVQAGAIDGRRLIEIMFRLGLSINAMPGPGMNLLVNQFVDALSGDLTMGSVDIEDRVFPVRS